MKQLWLLLPFLFAFNAKSADMRSKIGSTYYPPVVYQGNYYFVATTGVLYQSDFDFKKVEKLYEGKKQSMGSLLLHEGVLYWGDGLHGDRETTLHIYDLKNRKLLKDLSLKGHIERAPFASNSQIVVPLGPEGIMSLDVKTMKTKWHTQKHGGKDLHIDSNIVKDGSEICATTVYAVKGVVCFDESTGKETSFGELKRDPKSEITLHDHQVVGYATDADYVKNKWDIPSDLYVFHVKSKKFNFVKELRGFNFFAPTIADNQALVTLSTGDFITVNIVDGKIHFLGEFPEPFINNSFMKGSEYCGVGIAGKVLCYSKASPAGAITFDKRILETVIGKVLFVDHNLIVPTRMGYSKLAIP